MERNNWWCNAVLYCSSYIIQAWPPLSFAHTRLVSSPPRPQQRHRHQRRHNHLPWLLLLLLLSASNRRRTRGSARRLMMSVVKRIGDDVDRDSKAPCRADTQTARRWWRLGKVGDRGMEAGSLVVVGLYWLQGSIQHCTSGHTRTDTTLHGSSWIRVCVHAANVYVCVCFVYHVSIDSNM